MQINVTTITVIVGICSIVAFFLGQYAGVKRNGYEQGKRDAKIDELANKLDELVREFKELNMGALVQRVVALEKAVFNKKGE